VSFSSLTCLKQFCNHVQVELSPPVADVAAAAAAAAAEASKDSSAVVSASSPPLPVKRTDIPTIVADAMIKVSLEIYFEK